jgi:hypothetical protein
MQGIYTFAEFQKLLNKPVWYVWNVLHRFNIPYTTRDGQVVINKMYADFVLRFFFKINGGENRAEESTGAKARWRSGHKENEEVQGSIHQTDASVQESSVDSGHSGGSVQPQTDANGSKAKRKKKTN